MKIIECPRDAMQGLTEFIPTKDKVRYINQLLKVGFSTLDFGSFVSAKAIPQMKDTTDVVNALDLSGTKTNLLAIVANSRGAEEAAAFDQITFLGFPLSISETFQIRNTNKSIAEALDTLVEIKNLCLKTNKKLVTYISMGFGNPYGDPYDQDMVTQFMDILLTLGTDVISVADTVGSASPEQISNLFSSLRGKFTTTEIGIHLHSNPNSAYEKIGAAYASGCTRFDGALKGFGGCPMAKDDLVGNIPTEEIIRFIEAQGKDLFLNKNELAEAMRIADEIFPKR